jgi:hypothetical protein
VPIAPAEQVHRPSIALGDVDGDGIDDLVLGRNGAIVVRRGTRGTPERRFEEREQALPTRMGHMLGPVAVGVSCESAGQPRLRDVDGDGDLDVLAIDTELGGVGHVVWFANDGRGTFAAPRVAGGRQITATRSVDLADVDGDRRADLLVHAGELRLYPGVADGFAANGIDLGVRPSGSAVLADWDGDKATDLLYVDDRAVMLRRRTGDRFAPPERIAVVEGADELVQLAVGDWDGDGRLDLLLGDNAATPAPAAPAPAPAAAAETEARRVAAQRVLDAVQQEIARLNATKPPLGDAAAMAERTAWREQLDGWAAGPRALLAAARQQDTPSPGGRLRALMRR